MQPNNNRPPGEAEDPASNDAIDGAFAPGDSFSNDPSDHGGPGELPSWLQNFADVAVESAGTGSQEPASETSTQAVTPPEVAPPTAQSQADQSSEPTAQPKSNGTSPDPFSQAPVGSDASFFSEDDLPEWLRALSTDSTPATEAPPAMSVPVAAVTPNGSLQIPSVSRAWVTAADQQDTSPSANLMSSLVNVIDSRPDAVAVEPAVATPASSPVGKVSAPPQPAPAVAATPVPTSEEQPGNRKRLLMIAALIILVLIIIVMLLGN